MELKDFYNIDHTNLLFEPKQYEGEYFTTAGNVSAFVTLEWFTNNFYDLFPFGKYTFYLYQRYSLYKNGVEIYRNKNYNARCKNSKYCLMYDGPLTNREITVPFKNEFDKLSDAQAAAEELSQNMESVIICEIACFYDMY